METTAMTNVLSCLNGSLVAIVTPFRDTQLDASALAALCRRQIEAGTAALVVCGSTGEASCLNTAEYLLAVRVAVDAAAGRAPVIAGCTATATSTAILLANAARDAGAAALLLAAPPYNKPTQEGVFAHVRAIGHAACLPIMLYDIPGRVGIGITDDTIARLFEAELIFALKDATADLSRPPRLRARCGDGLLQFTGEDATAAAYRAMGGAGCVSVTANVAPALCASLHAAWDRRDIASFAATRDLLDPLHRALFTESNPIPVKAALELLELCSSAVRLPLTRATPATREALARVLPAIMLAEHRAGGKVRYALAS
ncbi:MAG TPA: 4-hydroxy-tetrahydrodipicolinate synthase [Acetobacteraceae bacterium]|nr:4-hydroxy-tetrahydrodipicolinate synthase [Acetobacteraceae bacterium]